MPYVWTHRPDDSPATDQPLAMARLWPHRSLPLPGFAAVMGFTFVMILIPTIPLIGTPVFWGLLPFLMGAVFALYYFVMRNYRDGELVEELTLWTDRMSLIRHNPRSPDQTWESNPYWVRLALHADKGPVRNYLTLRGGSREVELGAFLSPEERAALFDELDRLLKRLPQA